jgi:hypothetical protein
MRKLVGLGLVVTFACSLAAGAVIAAGRRQPIPVPLLDLRLTDCAPPCWIGIVPGETTLETAYRLVHAAFGEIPLTQTEMRSGAGAVRALQWVLNLRYGPVHIKLETHSSAVIDTITFDVQRADIPVADLYNLLGTPPRMARWHNNFPYFILVYGDEKRGTVVLSRLKERFEWVQPVETLILFGRGKSPVPPEDYEAWHGFLTLKGYYRRFP